VEWLLSKLDNDASRLQTAMCDGLAARLHDPAFREGVEWLLSKLDNDASRLQTAMCGGLAARLHEQNFKCNIDNILAYVPATEVFHTLMRLVRNSPFVRYISAISLRFLEQDEEEKRLMLTQFAGSYAKKQAMLLKWRMTPDKLT
jgi:hypothetical protein